ncbi:HET-domain-containing protein [Zopfia rhizophila CBS 207.26]|uniref:HET-domain-containing protein n=1 Tax=Zopfia rhizophila CBS 207.26 TaxID=1314779 RepID=A0A6A6EAB7_9PEZI|nr:HET-domain-containing protein [Zopfia rhizophila CBS 207.26]
MSWYHYSSLLPGPDSIRLLRLMPHEDDAARIQCELFDYSLHESGKGTHMFEALSYVWGDPDKPLFISIGEHDLPVTTNLHAALSRLRDRSFERIIWVDAICINQEDLQERSRQVQLVAKIYSKANRVIVWLGETADNSDRALEEIRIAADEEYTNSSNSETIQQAIFALLQRPWFRRIWVLQEVAAARHVLIMCGLMEIDGYAFCSGLKSLELSYETCPDLQSPVRSVTSLIRGAIFRPKYAISSSGRFSLDIRPLGELIDMFHTHEATLDHDKVYALLGMSSDDPSEAGLWPDYKISWQELFHRLVKFVLSREVSVATWSDRKTAVIKSKGCILGQVSLLKRDVAWADRQNVDIISKNAPRYLGYKSEWSAHWTLQASAKSVRQDDLVCLLQGASKPTIIRSCKDYFAVIMIAATPMKNIRTESGYVKWPELMRSIKTFPRDFLLVWDWESCPGKLQDREEFATLIETNSRVPGYSKTGLDDHLNKATRLRNVALILEDAKEHEEAVKRLREAIEGFERVFGKEHPHTLTEFDNLALIYMEKNQWKQAEELFMQAIQIRKRVQGADHPDTLSSMAALASTYKDQGHLEKAEKLEMMIHLLERRGDSFQITEGVVAKIARYFDKEVMALLFERRRDDVQITEGVIEAAARNLRSGKEVMTLLLERRRDDVQITEGVVRAAAGNDESGRKLMALLLERRGDEVQITEGVVEAAARNLRSGKEVMMLLLRQTVSHFQITERAIAKIASSFDKEVMTLILERRGEEVQITEGVVEAAAQNLRSGKEVMSLLLEQRGDQVQITERVVEAAARNLRSGKEVTSLLLEQRGDQVQITEGVVEAAAWNWSSGNEVITLLLQQIGNKSQIADGVLAKIARYFDREVITLLLERRGDEVQITEGVVEAAARNLRSGKEVMMLLLRRTASHFQITEGAVTAVSRSFDKEIVALLPERKGNEIQIMQGVTEATARNPKSGKEMKSCWSYQ